MKNIILAMAALVVLIGGSYLYFRVYKPTKHVENTVFTPQEVILDASQNSVSADSVSTEDTTDDAPAVKEVTVDATSFAFSPNVIDVIEGEKIKLTLNVLQGNHDWVLEGLEDQGIKTNTIATGQTATIEFDAPPAGEYIFYCSLPGHRSAGMVGKLIVSENEN